MRTGMLVFGMTASGILGGVVGALLVGAPGPGAGGPGSGAAPSATAAASPSGPASAEGGLEELRNRLAALEGNLAANAAETARLRESLEAERKASAALRERVEEGGAAAGGHFGPGQVHFGSAGREGAVEAGAAFQALALALPERLRKSGELRRLPEEEQWAKAREALGLTGYQEEELKAAIRERSEAMREATKVVASESTAEDGSSSRAVTIAMPDIGKMEEARKRYDDRVSQALNAEQRKSWREEGYEGALGGGGGASMSFVTTDVEVGPGVAPEGK